MKSESIHLSELELMLAADGELPAKRKAEVAAHLESCWSCRERMQSLEGAITDFVRARNHELTAQIPSSAGPSALLRARMAEASSEPIGWFRSWRPGWLAFPAVAVAVFLVAIVIFGTNVNAEGPKPKAMTPGEARPITLEEVCMYERAEVISRDIPEDKRRQVFALYGIKSPKDGQYEVDYLITPDLGGTESVRNLWPEPYSARWNAKVKDELEQRLHELVCSRKLDLATAQHDMATDWIGAYRKYVSNDSPH